MGALSDDAESRRVAECFSLELATLLGGHYLCAGNDQKCEDGRGNGILPVWISEGDGGCGGDGDGGSSREVDE